MILVVALLLAVLGCGQEAPSVRNARVLAQHGADIRVAVAEMITRESLDVEPFDLRRSVVIWETSSGVDLRLRLTRSDGCGMTLAVMGTSLGTAEPQWTAQATPDDC